MSFITFLRDINLGRSSHQIDPTRNSAPRQYPDHPFDIPWRFGDSYPKDAIFDERAQKPGMELEA
jgi:hypothetical protein